MELRYLQSAELRAAGNKIEGYAAVFDSPSAGLGFTEYVEPGAFSRSIRNKDDVFCLFNHDRNIILGRTSSGTCRLSEDSTGLEFSCDISQSQQSRDIYTSIQRGDISGCSFAFNTRKDKWSEDGKTRTLLDVDLFDVSVVATPAYPATSVSARAVHPGVTRTGSYEFRRRPDSSVYLPAGAERLEDLRRRDKARLLRYEILTSRAGQ